MNPQTATHMQRRARSLHLRRGASPRQVLPAWGVLIVHPNQRRLRAWANPGSGMKWSGGRGQQADHRGAAGPPAPRWSACHRARRAHWHSARTAPRRPFSPRGNGRHARPDRAGVEGEAVPAKMQLALLAAAAAGVVAIAGTMLKDRWQLAQPLERRWGYEEYRRDCLDPQNKRREMRARSCR